MPERQAGLPGAAGCTEVIYAQQERALQQAAAMVAAARPIVLNDSGMACKTDAGMHQWLQFK